MLNTLRTRLQQLIDGPDGVSPARYRSLRRLMTVLMVAVSVTPLIVLSGFSHRECMRTIESALDQPVYTQARKARASLELFLGERMATVSLIANAYGYDDLLDENKFNRIFYALNHEFRGFVDMGLVNAEGRQVMYTGPYELKNADYKGQKWLADAQSKGKSISGAFLGLRGIPHMVIAVHRLDESGRSWTLRMTVDTAALEQLVSDAETKHDTDLFVCDVNGVLQTKSSLYGEALGKIGIPVPLPTREMRLQHLSDSQNGDLAIASSRIAGTDFIIVAVRSHTEVFRPWIALGIELLIVLCVGIVLIILVSHLLMKFLIGKLQTSDERRARVFAQMEETQKLSSLGRLAAGVAHEVNNPLAVIGEKAGLALDFLKLAEDAQAYEKRRERLITLLESIESTVDRAKGITHRLLSFSKRMEANRQKLDVRNIVSESAEFLQRSAMNRGIKLLLDFPDKLPDIVSDRGLLQQVFLNLMGNALDACTQLPSGQKGEIRVACAAQDDNYVLVSVKDNGHGMDEEVQKHIFEPFYTTKKDKGNGLGMFITYGIVRRLGGNITIESEPGQGTTISVLLPVEQSVDNGGKQ